MQTNEITELRTVLKQKEIEVEVLAETNRKLNKRITDQHLELEKKNGRFKKGKSEHEKLQAETKVLKTGIQPYEGEIASLNSTIAERESELNEMRQTSIVETSAEDAITKLEKIMTKKLEEVQQTLKVSLLAEVTKNNKQFEDKTKGMIKENKSYAETVKNSQVAMNATPQSTNTIDLRSIIREEQNEQLAEESDKKAFLQFNIAWCQGKYYG